MQLILFVCIVVLGKLSGFLHETKTEHSHKYLWDLSLMVELMIQIRVRKIA